MRKTIEISGKQVEFNSSAATPMYYRRAFNSDMFTDLQEISALEGEEMKKVQVVEQMAFAMTADCKKGVDFLEWLDQFDMIEFTEKIEQILSLLGMSASVETEEGTENGKKVKATEN